MSPYGKLWASLLSTFQLLRLSLAAQLLLPPFIFISSSRITCAVLDRSYLTDSPRTNCSSTSTTKRVVVPVNIPNSYSGKSSPTTSPPLLHQTSAPTFSTLPTRQPSRSFVSSLLDTLSKRGSFRRDMLSPGRIDTIPLRTDHTQSGSSGQVSLSHDPRN